MFDNRKPKKMSPEDIRKMETVCRIAAEGLQHARSLLRPGMSTQDIDDAVRDFAQMRGVRCAPLNYHGFPKHVCTSVNDVVCHGAPAPDEFLKEGDIINIDVTFEKDGFYGDTSASYPVGIVSAEAQRIMDCAYKAMMAGIAEVKAGRFTGDIGAATNEVVKSYGYHAVVDIGGHGIGRAFHLDPFVPAVGVRKNGERLIENTCLTVEPMINATNAKYKTFPIPNSRITYFRTLDGSLSAQYEHTVLVTREGPRILTLPPE